MILITITIEGIPGHDGQYELDSNFTNREWHTVKRLSGVRTGEFVDSLIAGDNDLVVAMAVLGMERARRPVNEEALWNAADGCIGLEVRATEDDADPPAQSEPASPASESEKLASSGNGSEGDGVLQESRPSPIGSRA